MAADNNVKDKIAKELPLPLGLVLASERWQGLIPRTVSRFKFCRLDAATVSISSGLVSSEGGKYIQESNNATFERSSWLHYATSDGITLVILCCIDSL